MGSDIGMSLFTYYRFVDCLVLRTILFVFGVYILNTIRRAQRGTGLWGQTTAEPYIVFAGEVRTLERGLMADRPLVLRTSFNSKVSLQ